jgi:hypothetical protein
MSGCVAEDEDCEPRSRSERGQENKHPVSVSAHQIVLGTGTRPVAAPFLFSAAQRTLTSLDGVFRSGSGGKRKAKGLSVPEHRGMKTHIRLFASPADGGEVQ